MIHIDSSNRNINQFPNNTEFEIPINEKENLEGDARSTIQLNTDVQYFFQWVGNSELNNPLSKFTNDTFVANVIPIATNQCILIPPNTFTSELIHVKNYFVGIKLWFEYTRKLSTVHAYDHLTRTLTFNTDIFEYFFENIEYEDHKDKNLSEFYRKGYFVNTSFHQDNNFIILGEEKTMYSNYIVENVSKRWKKKLVEKNGLYFLQEFTETFDMLDTYIIYKSPVNNERMLSFEFDSELLYDSKGYYGVTLLDSVSFLDSTNNILCILDKKNQSKSYFEIKKEEDNTLYFSTEAIVDFNTTNFIVIVLPSYRNFSTMTIDQHSYGKNVFLQLRYLSLPNKKIKSNYDLLLQNIPYLTIKINKKLVMDRISSNIPNFDSTFVCFTENRKKNEYILFRSQQIVQLQEIFRHGLHFSIMLPNNENLIFEESDIVSSQTGNLLVYNVKNILSIVFQIVSL